MKICYQCIQKKKLKVEQPQMLIVFRGCDTCKKQFVSSFNEEDVIIQTKKLKLLA